MKEGTNMCLYIIDSRDCGFHRRQEKLNGEITVLQDHLKLWTHRYQEDVYILLTFKTRSYTSYLIPATLKSKLPNKDEKYNMWKICYRTKIL